MTDENKPTAEPVLKKNIPDVLYPGVPIEEAAEEQKEIAAEAGSPPPSSEEQPGEEEKQAFVKKAKETENKILVGKIIFKVLFFLNIYLMYDFFRKSFLIFEQMTENGTSEEIIAFLIKIMLFFAPIFSFGVLAVFMRLLIGCSVGKKAAEFIIIMSLYQYFVKAAYFGKEGTGIFLSALAVSSYLSEAIITYSGGGFFRHIANQIKQIWVKLMPKGL